MVISVFKLAAWFFEVHIAVCFACAMCGRLRLLRQLSNSLWYLWLLALAFAIAFAACGYWHIDNNQISMLGCTYLVCLLLVLISYLVALSRAFRKAGQAVQNRVWERSCLFPSMFVGLNGPLILGLFHLADGNQYWIFVSGMSNLNAFLNVAVYTWTNKRLRNSVCRCCCKRHQATQSAVARANPMPRDSQMLQLQFASVAEEHHYDVTVSSFRYDEDIVLLPPHAELTPRAEPTKCIEEGQEVAI